MINPKHTTAYMLFNYKFNFHIAALHFYPQAYLDHVGSLSTGDKKQDRELMKEPVFTRDTIVVMAQHHANDVPVYLDNPRDAVEIYEIIRMHLDKWTEVLKYEHNLDLPPVEDFEILDEFAASIYEIGRRFKPDLRTRVSLSSRLSKLRGGIGRTVERTQKGQGRVITHHASRFDKIDDLYAQRIGEINRGTR